MTILLHRFLVLCAFSQALLQNCNVAFPEGFCTARHKVTGKPRQCREVICSSGWPVPSPKFKFEILSLELIFRSPVLVQLSLLMLLLSLDNTTNPYCKKILRRHSSFILPSVLCTLFHKKRSATKSRDEYAKQDFNKGDLNAWALFDPQKLDKHQLLLISHVHTSWAFK